MSDAFPPRPLLPGAPGPMHRGPVAAAVRAMMRRSLAGAFRRVTWHGPVPSVPDDRPLVVVANHHSFFDGYLGWLVCERVFGRRILIWMRDWDAFPFFAAMGALPFPEHDAAARGATIRFTARRFQTPGYALWYLPEGELRPPDAGVGPFDEALTARLGRLLAPAVWVPVGLHATWEGHARPVVKIAAGAPREGIVGDERDVLADVLQRLRDDRSPGRRLFGGAESPQERWDFRAAAPAFRRYLR